MTPFYWQKIASTWNDYWWGENEDRVKTGLQLNIKMAKITTTEELHNFNKDTKIVKRFPDVQSSVQVEIAAKKFEDWDVEGKLWRHQEKSWKTCSWRQRPKLFIPWCPRLYRCERWTIMKSHMEKNMFNLKSSVGEEFHGYPEPPDGEINGTKSSLNSH